MNARRPVLVVVLLALASLAVLVTPRVIDAQDKILRCGPLQATSSDNLESPLHPHFGRTHLSFRPLGRLRPKDDRENQFDQFDNFGDDFQARVYVDDAGVEYLLQPPKKSEFHHPDTANWEDFSPLYRRPTSRVDYPNRKFVSRPDSNGRSFEIVLGPDQIGVSGEYTYDNQRIVRGPLGGSFNWSDANRRKGGPHLVEDVWPHMKQWESRGGTRDGSKYQLVDPARDISPKRGESPSQFGSRWSSLVDDFLELRKRTNTEDQPLFPWTLATYEADGQQRYRLLFEGGPFVDDFDIPVELNGAFEDYLRHVNQDCRLPRTKPASATGDPHFVTFDGLAYDFQGHGEFILAAINGGDGPIIQVRQVPPDSGGDITITSGVAMEVNGSRITIQRGRNEMLHIDGEPVSLSVGDEAITNSAGVEIAIERIPTSLRSVDAGIEYKIWWGAGVKGINVGVFESSISVHPTITSSDSSVGLLGDSDGDRGNDFSTRDGRLLAKPHTVFDIHRVFGESWRVTAEESLFDYESGTSTETFTDRFFPNTFVTLQDLDSNLRRRAAAACRSGGVTLEPFHSSCVLDYGLTGNEAYILAAGAAANKLTSVGACAISFDGLNDQVLVDHQFESEQFSFEAWILAESVNQNDFVTGAGIATYGRGNRAAWTVWLMAPDLGPPANVGLHAELNIEILSRPFTIGESGRPTDPVGLNEWVHVAVTYDGESQRNLLINGEVAASDPWTSKIETDISNPILILGNEVPGLEDYFGGEIDEVRVWSIARTEAEIQENYRRQVDPNAEGLEGYYRFDECRGQTIFDLSPHNRHGNLGVGPRIDSADPSYVASGAPIDR